MEGTLQIVAGREHNFSFQLHRKARARGRVIDAVTGEPVANIGVDGEIASHPANSRQSRQTAHWLYVSDATTDQSGAYSITLAPGPVRMTASGIGYAAEGDPVEGDVAADGTTVLPDSRVRRLPKVTGTVYDVDGEPLAGAIVRLRGNMLTVQPTVTDVDGRFGLALNWLRYDPITQQPLVLQPLVAFHPFKPLSAKVDVRLDDADSITDVMLRLEPHTCESLLTGFLGEMSDWERGIVPADHAAELAAQSLKGQPAPEVDGLVWLNAPRASMRLRPRTAIKPVRFLFSGRL